MIIPDAIITDLLSNPALKKSDARTILFLLQNPGALSSDELAAGVGVSKKSVNKSIKRLISAGVIQAGEPQAKKTTFIVHSSEPKEPPAVTGKDDPDSLSLLMEKIDRIEALLNTMTGRPGDGSASAPIHDGQNGTLIMPFLSCMENSELINGQNGIEAGHKVTQAVIIPAPDGQNENRSMPVCSHVDQQKNMQDKKETVNIPKGTIGTEQGTNGTQNDSIVSELDDAITRAGARLAALKAASLLKEKQQSSFSDTCTPASIDAEFHALFGVQLPAWSDQAAAGVMIARKKSGKLDVKSPLAYLNSLSGKVPSILVTSQELNPEIRMSVKPTTGIPPASVTENRLDHETIDRINRMWDAMTVEQRTPFEATALPKFEAQTGKYKVPLHILAKSVFNAEQLKACGQLG